MDVCRKEEGGGREQGLRFLSLDEREILSPVQFRTFLGPVDVSSSRDRFRMMVVLNESLRMTMERRATNAESEYRRGEEKAMDEGSGR